MGYMEFQRLTNSSLMITGESLLAGGLQTRRSRFRDDDVETSTASSSKISVTSLRENPNFAASQYCPAAPVMWECRGE